MRPWTTAAARIAVALILSVAAGCGNGEDRARDAGPDSAVDAAADAVDAGDGGRLDGAADADSPQRHDTSDAATMSDVPWPDVAPRMCGRFTAAGAFEVGVTEIEVDGTPVEVWYPAADGATDGEDPARYDMRQWLPADEQDKIPDDAAPLFEMDAYRDVAASDDGPFPLVLFSHGFAGYRMQSTFLTTHLASWGYVVASTDHPERNLAAVLAGDVSMDDTAPQAMQAVRRELVDRSMDGSGRFAGLLDAGKVAVTGHSAGAQSAVTYASDRNVDAVVGMAGAQMDTSSELDLGAEVFLMAGSKDGIIPASRVKSAWDAIQNEKRYLNVRDAGHLAFSDICLVGRDRGGLLEIASSHGVDVPAFIKTLAQDGCRSDDLPPELAWPVINHFAVAQLRSAFGDAADDEELGASTADCFDGLVDDFKVDDGS